MFYFLVCFFRIVFVVGLGWVGFVEVVLGWWECVGRGFVVRGGGRGGRWIGFGFGFGVVDLGEVRLGGVVIVV